MGLTEPGMRVTELPRLGAAHLDGADLLYVVDVSAGTSGSMAVTVDDLLGRPLVVMIARLASSAQEADVMLAAARGGRPAILAYADWLGENGRPFAPAWVRERAGGE